MLWVVIGGLFVVHYLLSRFGPTWCGGIMSLAWIGAVIYLGVTGRLNGFRDYIVAAIGFFVLLVIWGGGIEGKRRKIAAESDRVDLSRGL